MFSNRSLLHDPSKGQMTVNPYLAPGSNRKKEIARGLMISTGKFAQGVSEVTDAVVMSNPYESMINENILKKRLARIASRAAIEAVDFYMKKIAYGHYGVGSTDIEMLPATTELGEEIFRLLDSRMHVIGPDLRKLVLEKTTKKSEVIKF